MLAALIRGVVGSLLAPLALPLQPLGGWLRIRIPVLPPRTDPAMPLQATAAAADMGGIMKEVDLPTLLLQRVQPLPASPPPLLFQWRV